MLRILQFRCCEDTATFCLEDYTESVVDAIKNIRRLMYQYPHDLYFDFEVNAVNKAVEYMDSIDEWYDTTKFNLSFYGKEEPLYKDENEARKYLKVISDYYGFE